MYMPDKFPDSVVTIGLPHPCLSYMSSTLPVGQNTYKMNIALLLYNRDACPFG